MTTAQVCLVYPQFLLLVTNTSGPAGIKISQCTVKRLFLLRLRWTDSCCTPWSIIIPSSVAVGQVYSVMQAAAVPSLPAPLHHSDPMLRDGKTDKWGKNGDRKAIFWLHKFLRLWYLSLATVTANYYLESGNRCLPINIKWVGVCRLSPVTRLYWLFTAQRYRPCTESCPESQLYSVASCGKSFLEGWEGENDQFLDTQF